MAIKPDKGSKFYWVACARAKKKYIFSTICTHPVEFQANEMGRQTKKAAFLGRKNNKKNAEQSPSHPPRPAPACGRQT